MVKVTKRSGETKASGQAAKLAKRLSAAQALEAKRRRQLAEAEAMVATLIGSQPAAPAKATVVRKPAAARARKVPTAAKPATTRKPAPTSGRKVPTAAKPATTRKPALTTRKGRTTKTEPDAGSAT